jgi:hypothetical protein
MKTSQVVDRLITGHAYLLSEIIYWSSLISKLLQIVHHIKLQLNVVVSL